MSNYIFVDVEALGRSPVNGTMTEFGAVHGTSKEIYHGILLRAHQTQITQQCLLLVNA